MADESRSIPNSAQLAIPFRLAPNGHFAMTEGRDKQLAQRVRAVVATLPGERRMRPDFGADLGPVLFSPSNGVTNAEVARIVTDALLVWEPQAEIREVIPVVEEDRGLVDVQVNIIDSTTPEEITEQSRRLVFRPGGRIDG